MGMKKCPECNNLVDESLKECNFCGYPFDGTEELVEELDTCDTEVENGETTEELEEKQNTGESCEVVEEISESAESIAEKKMIL